MIKALLLVLSCLAALLSSRGMAVEAVGFGDGVLHLGTNGYAAIPDSQFQGFDCQTNFSVEVVLNIEANAAGGRWPVLLGKKYSPQGNDAGFALSLNQGQFKTVGQQVYAVLADGSRQAALSSRFFQGMVHAVMSWNAQAKVLTLYINGQSEGSVTNVLLTGSLRNAQSFAVGGPSNYGEPLQRDVLLSRLWNRALTAAEVGTIWTNWSALNLRTLPAGLDRTGLVSEWLMQDLADATHLTDTQGRNPLQLQGSASLWQGLGVLSPEFPADGATNISKSVTLKAAGGLATLAGNPVRPLQYYFEVDETNSFASPALKRSGWRVGYGTWKPVLKPATQYFWRVRVRDAAGTPVQSGFAATNSFATKAATDWYVRPGIYTQGEDPATYAPVPQAGIYGRQDGTTYADAWNGIPSVVWGENGVEAGDTLWVCGIHYWVMASTASYITAYVTESGYSEQYPITIRTDYSADPGTLWGCSGRTYNSNPNWLGPDANGVYSISSPSVTTLFCLVGNTNLVLLKQQSAPTWAGDYGAFYWSNNICYIKTPDGTSPGNRLFTPYFGYRFNLGRSSNIRFLNCRFYNAAPAMDEISNYPERDTQTRIPVSSHIVFDGCDLRYGAELTLTPGNDYWTVRNSELSSGPYGVYTLLNRRLYGANYLTVSNCYIHDMAIPQFPHPDGHGVGVQGGTGHLIQGNRVEDTGSAIVFWTGNAPMTNHVICRNFIKNVKLLAPDGSCDGIAVSGDNTLALPGMRTGFKIFDNIVLNPGVGSTQSWQGLGISSSSPDFIEIYNNVVYNANKGIWLSVATAPPQAKIVNNIICNSRDYYLWVAGAPGSATNLFIDYNLFYPVPNLSSNFMVYPVVPHDQHSIFTNPLFVSNPPASPGDFRLGAGSRAIGAGTPVSLQQDYAGNPIPTTSPPDIGAYEWMPSTGASQPTNLHVVPGGL